MSGAGDPNTTEGSRNTLSTRERKRKSNELEAENLCTIIWALPQIHFVTLHWSHHLPGQEFLIV